MRSASSAALRDQRIYRALLELTARPGTCRRLSAPGAPAWEALLVCLLDHEVSFAVVGEEGGPIAARLSAATGASEHTVAEADFALLAAPNGSALRSLRQGSPEEPADGATAIVLVDRLTYRSGGTVLRLSGPGIDGDVTIGVEPFDAEACEAIQATRSDYPRGVDVYLTDAAGVTAALPRSTTVQVVSRCSSA